MFFLKKTKTNKRPNFVKFTCFGQPSVCCMFRLACEVFLCLILLQHFLFLFLVFEGLGSCQSAFFSQLFFGRLQASHDTPLTFCPFHKYFRCESFLPPVTSQSTKVYFPNSQVFLSIAQSSNLKKKTPTFFLWAKGSHTMRLSMLLNNTLIIHTIIYHNTKKQF